MSDRPYQPFYKPYGMSDEEYSHERNLAQQKLTEWEQEQAELQMIEEEINKGRKQMSLESKMDAISQAYCADRNKHKEVDVDLLTDIKQIALTIAREYADEQIKEKNEKIMKLLREIFPELATEVQ